MWPILGKKNKDLEFGQRFLILRKDRGFVGKRVSVDLTTNTCRHDLIFMARIFPNHFLIVHFQIPFEAPLECN